MKKNIILAVTLILCFAMFSCEDTREDNMTVNKVYITKSGEAKITLYETGANNTYGLGLYRSGKNGMSANAKVKILSQSEVDQYNTENGTDYLILPANCYKILNTEVNFGGKDDDVNQLINIEFDPTATKAIIEVDIYKKYTVPVRLESSSIEINTAKNISFVLPEVKEPLVRLGLTGSSSYEHKAGTVPASVEIDMPVIVDFENQWDITCNLEANQEALDQYNTENETFFAMLPAETYTMQTSVVITKGQKIATSKIRVDGKKLTPGNYILPIRLKSVSKFGVNPDIDRYFIVISVASPELARTGWKVVDWNTFASSGEGTNGGVDKILDGDVATYWHSQWSGSTATPENPVSRPLPHFLVIDMLEQYNVTQMSLSRRQNNSATEGGYFYVTSDDVPALVAAGRRDDINWTRIGSFTMKTENGPQIFGVLKSKSRYVKIEITRSRNGVVTSLAEAAAHGYK